MQKIKVLTVATEPHPRLEDLKLSCKNNGMDLTVLGMGEGWQGFGTKIIITRDYLRTLTGYTHFIFADAYDVLFLKPVTEVPDYILFSTEKQSWPDVDAYGPDYKQDGRWKFLNSGSYSAPIKDWMKLVDANTINYSDDDQRYFTKIYLNDSIIKLDTGCTIFQSYAFAVPGDFTITAAGLKNNRTETSPAIIHFNGKCIDNKIYAMIKYNSLAEVQAAWKDDENIAKQLHEGFIERVNAIDQLNEHRTFVENHVWGFGERSFHWLWNLVIKEMPADFTFLEVGVFKGQTLSLCELIAKMQNKKAARYGVTPLSTDGGVWESDYKKDIEFIHDKFELPKNYKILNGLSEDPEIIKQASKLKLDILYIDGGHEERHIKNDFENYAHLVEPGGYLVIDDSCNTFQMPFGYFCGIDTVTRYVDSVLPPVTPNKDWKFCFSIVHNRVYRRV